MKCDQKLAMFVGFSVLLLILGSTNASYEAEELSTLKHEIIKVVMSAMEGRMFEQDALLDMLMKDIQRLHTSHSQCSCTEMRLLLEKKIDDLTLEVGQMKNSIIALEHETGLDNLYDEEEGEDF